VLPGFNSFKQALRCFEPILSFAFGEHFSTMNNDPHNPYPQWFGYTEPDASDFGLLQPDPLHMANMGLPQSFVLGQALGSVRLELLTGCQISNFFPIRFQLGHTVDINAVPELYLENNIEPQPDLAEDEMFSMRSHPMSSGIGMETFTEDSSAYFVGEINGYTNLAYLSALPFAHNDLLPAIFPNDLTDDPTHDPTPLHSDGGFIDHPDSRMLDPRLSTLMGPPPPPIDNHPTSGSHSHPKLKWYTTKSSFSASSFPVPKRSTGSKVLPFQLEYYCDAPDDSGVVYAIFLALLHVEVTEEVFPDFTDAQLGNFLNRAKQLYLDEPANTKNPSMLCYL
jgi:hypothetical protein